MIHVHCKNHNNYAGSSCKYCVSELEKDYALTNSSLLHANELWIDLEDTLGVAVRALEYYEDMRAYIQDPDYDWDISRGKAEPTYNEEDIGEAAREALKTIRDRVEKTKR